MNKKIIIMDLVVISSSQQIINQPKKNQHLSQERVLNYYKSSLQKQHHVTTIHVDSAQNGKDEFSGIKTYTQNVVKRYELSGNKEMCLRKIMISEREDELFDITVRELNVFYRNDKKQSFNHVLRFKSTDGNIEHIFEVLKNKAKVRQLRKDTKYFLN